MAYSISSEGRVLYLPVHLLHPGQTGRGKPTALLQELAASIRELGILQPLTVRKTGDSYQVVSGNRRLMAAKMAGLGEVPCLITRADGADAELIALTENLQREDLGYFQEAEYLQAYLAHSGLTQAQAAKKLGRSQSAIANKLRLLQHSPKVRQALLDNGATVIVIEHDLDVIRNADFVIDMGPGGGEDGGRIVAAGTPQEIKGNKDSLTGRYL